MRLAQATSTTAEVSPSWAWPLTFQWTVSLIALAVLTATVALASWLSPSLRRQVRMVLRWADTRSPTQLFIAAIGIGVLLIPPLREWQVIENPWWLIVWVVLLLSRWGYTRVRRGTVAEQSDARVTEVHASLAGTINQIAPRLAESSDGKLSAADFHGIGVALLHRIKDYAEFAMDVPDGVRLRVTLAVPIRSKRGLVQKVGILMYDQPYDDSRYSEFSVRPGDPVKPGCATAFLTGEMQIIEDLWEKPEARKLLFRSVLSLPVRAGGPSGKTLAVVNIDATQERFFQLNQVLLHLRPLLGPPIALLGVVLLLMRPGEKHVPRTVK